MLVTPDYGLSDIWNFNYPLKNLLSESLKQGKFPLWTDIIGNGFPIGAEGQIGAFSPLNWLVFGLLSMPQAFTAALFSTFVVAFAGSYLLMRKIGLPKVLSAVSALFASFNGYFIVQMTHLNLLQSFSFIPWALLFTEKLSNEKNLRSVLWLGVILAQMILVGYPQTFINSLLILVVYSAIRNWRKKISNLIKIMSGALIAILLSAIQIVPLFELVKQSDTLSAAAGQRFIHPLPIKNLLTVFHPFIFGNPSKGTYSYYGKGWPIFWENLLYVGIIPVLALIFGMIKKRNSVTTKFLEAKKAILAVFLIGLILALGRNTPAGLLFKLPPLSFTRIEPRFLAFSNIALGLLAGFFWIKTFSGFSKNLQTEIVFVIAFLHLFQVSWTFKNYHLWGNDELWLNKPEVVEKLGNSPKIVTVNQERLWEKIDAYQGWRNKENSVRYAGGTLGPNSNMIFNIKQLGAYAQQYPRRFDKFRHFIYGNDVLGKNIRDVFGVTHILDASSGKIEIIENPSAMPDVWTSSKIYKVKDIGEALGRIAQSDFIPGEILWESETLPNENEKIIVFNRSWYPGWKAYVNNKQIKIYPVNINQQSVIVPFLVSPSEISLRYDPISYKIGLAITAIASAGWILLFIKFKPKPL
ncbi:hypothetical protein HYU89_03480 [Candidatus Collierbacteria bacterium]|nr:hypothetical protein [Candidatus Collierbacteria bacterium]